MMYIGNPLELKEHLMMPSKKKCLEKKEIAELTSSAYYECAEVNAVVKGRKIINWPFRRRLFSFWIFAALSASSQKPSIASI